MFAQIGADLVERAGRDLGAIAQPGHQLAVVDDEAAEGRFRGPGRAAKIPDLGQDFFRGPAGHAALGLSLVLAPLLFDPHGFALFAALLPCADSGNRQWEASTTNRVGNAYGHVPTPEGRFTSRAIPVRGCRAAPRDRPRTPAFSTALRNG